MSEDDKNQKIPKKRGRKPKKAPVLLSNSIIKKNSEEEPLIAHLDLKSEDIDKLNSEQSEQSEQDEDINSVFLKGKEIKFDNKNIHKSESADDNSKKFKNSPQIKLEEFNNTNLNLLNTKEEQIEYIEQQIFNLKLELHKLLKNSDIKINKSSFSKDTKCWWCKNSFDTPSVSLPETYFDEKFQCYGHFCSYNCCHAYNLDCNDNVWKRNSLLHLLYFKTYGKNVNINSAPHWTSLKEFGGNLTLEEFRKNSVVNTNEFLMLKPPIDSRLNFFEKHYKPDSAIFSNSMYQKLLDDSDDLVIKRSKPLKSANYSLDKTLGFIKKKRLEVKMNEPINTNVNKLISANN